MSLKTLYHKLFRSEFLRNVATLATGTTFAQVISVGTAPILYRIYEKTDYGTLGVYMAVTGVIGTFSTLQYTQAILLEKEDMDAKQVMWLARMINVVIALLALIVVFIGKDFIALKLNAPQVAPWLFLIPVSIFFSGQNEIFRVWANRKKKYKVLTFNTILIAILVPTISISLGLMYAGPLGLFVGLLASHVVPPLVMTYALTRDETLGLSVMQLEGVKVQAKKHVNFPRFSLPSAFINRFSNQLPVFMLSTFAGTATVGVYNLTVRMLGLPSGLIAGAISEVFRQRATGDYNKNGTCRPIFLKTLKALVSASIVPFVIFLFFAPDIFAFVFGENWRIAGDYARILSILYMFKFIVSPLSFTFFLSGKNKEDFLIRIPLLIGVCLSLFIGLKFSTVLNAIALFTITRTLFYILILKKSYNYSKKIWK